VIEIEFSAPNITIFAKKRPKTGFRFSFDPDTSPENGPKKWPFLANFFTFLGDPSHKKVKI
jgi:hypothetical protein